MREAAEEQQQEPAAGEAGSSVCAEPAGSGHCGQPWKKFVYVEPPKRVKEVLEEELYFWRDGCQIKHPAAGCFFPAQWAIADLAKLPMNARAVSRSGSGRNMECEKKFLRGRLDTSITEQKQFTFTAQVLFQAWRNKKIG
ncbi:uncharacterized protein C11orf97 homolog [Chelonoidis abingdonii]|uniref:uncharacterized protein C11orf97 homolog n=1 Tax=Chelonoidis abingdonii TaxID=106734 RepID=UPI003F492968